MQFHHTPVPRVAYLQTPTREEIPEENTLQAQVEEPTQDEELPHSAVERMAEAVGQAVGV